MQPEEVSMVKDADMSLTWQCASPGELRLPAVSWAAPSPVKAKREEQRSAQPEEDGVVLLSSDDEEEQEADEEEQVGTFLHARV